jgi:RNA polymerase sigma-70 factor (ECF subfamily)
MAQPDRITNAFTTLREQMLSLAERITGNRDDAADAVQDAFVKLWQQRGRYETTRHAQGAGMMTVRTTSIDMARRNSHQADVPVEQATDIIEEPTNEERNLTYQQVRRIIDSELSNNQRMIIDMREVQGMEFDEIAAQLGMQPANVRVELSRARKRVRETYQARRKEMNS